MQLTGTGDTLAEQRAQLDRTLAEQREQLDRTLAEQHVPHSATSGLPPLREAGTEQASTRPTCWGLCHGGAC